MTTITYEDYKIILRGFAVQYAVQQNEIANREEQIRILQDCRQLDGQQIIALRGRVAYLEELYEAATKLKAPLDNSFPTPVPVPLLPKDHDLTAGQLLQKTSNDF